MPLVTTTLPLKIHDLLAGRSCAADRPRPSAACCGRPSRRGPRVPAAQRGQDGASSKLAGMGDRKGRVIDGTELAGHSSPQASARHRRGRRRRCARRDCRVSRQRPRLTPCFARSGDQVVGDRERTLVRAGQRARRVVAAVDAQRRARRRSCRPRPVACLAQLGWHAEASCRRRGTWRRRRRCFAMKAAMSAGLSSRWRSMWIAKNTLRCIASTWPMRLERVEDPWCAPNGSSLKRDRHAAEGHVGRQLLDPGSSAGSKQ